eukprot:4576285-Amphidinium_carterae.1
MAYVMVPILLAAVYIRQRKTGEVRNPHNTQVHIVLAQLSRTDKRCYRQPATTAVALIVSGSTNPTKSERKAE